MPCPTRLAPRAALVALALAGCAGAPVTRAGDPLDQRSYQLGIVAAFAEVVARDVKRLALSSPLPPALATEIAPDVERIAKENGVRVLREREFLTTDLFPAAATEGKHVFFIFKDDAVPREYEALKTEKEALLAANRWSGEPRLEVARRLGRLLSYPDAAIEELLAKSAARAP